MLHLIHCVSPAPAAVCSAQWCTLNGCWTTESLAWEAYSTFWKSTVNREKDGSEEERKLRFRVIAENCSIHWKHFAGRGQEGLCSLIYGSLYPIPCSHRGGPKCTATTIDFSHSLYCQWLKCLTFKLSKSEIRSPMFMPIINIKKSRNLLRIM